MNPVQTHETAADPEVEIILGGNTYHVVIDLEVAIHMFKKFGMNLLHGIPEDTLGNPEQLLELASVCLRDPVTGEPVQGVGKLLRVRTLPLFMLTVTKAFMLSQGDQDDLQKRGKEMGLPSSPLVSPGSFAN